MKVIVGVVFEYDDDNKKVKTETFIHKINEQTIVLELILMHLLLISLNHWWRNVMAHVSRLNEAGLV